MSAGTAADAETPLSGELIEWADEIVAMESRQLRQVRKQFGPWLKEKRLVSLDIPDRYTFMQDEWIAELHRKAYRWG